MCESVATVRALGHDVRHARRNSTRRQTGAQAREPRRAGCGRALIRSAESIANRGRRNRTPAAVQSRLDELAHLNGNKSMMLYILRHATAEEAASSGDDGARKLTDRSKEKMRGAAAGLRAMGLKFNLILTSPLARAAETAEIVSAAYENNPPPQVLPALATGVPATEAVAALRAFSKHEDVIIVGHEPQLSAVASILLTGASDVVHIKIKTGGCLRSE